jgi:signal transduction histidine kinase
MSKFFFTVGLTIRQKVVVGFVLALIAVLLIGYVGYRNLVRIERKLRFVEGAQEFHYAILEVRRYEKNYLLYGLTEDHEAAIDYLELGKAIFLRVQPDVRGLKGAIQLEKLQEEMDSYGQLWKEMGELTKSQGDTLRQKDEIELQLRSTGKDLVDLSLKLANFEHSRIIKILQYLKTNLGYMLLIILLLGLFLIVLVTRMILRPLKVIEKTTQRIARGDFKPIPVRQTKDETQAVVTAFNTMISELESHQEQLVRAQKLSSLGILTSGIAHQLNNTDIDHEVDRARDIVKGLLEFSRERDFQLSWVNLKELVVRTKGLVSSELPAGVEITSEIPPDLDIYVDAQKFQEVLLNLLLNAAQAIPDGKGRVSIMVKKDQQKVEIDVQDTGAGILPEHLPCIFDPFFTTKAVGLGTGLGLSVAYGIVERHGGTLTAKSEVGEGSIFTIKIPLKGEPAYGEQRS